MSGANRNPIFNRNAPIIVFNDSSLRSNSQLETAIRYKGLVNRVLSSNDADNLFNLYAFKLVVIIIDIGMQLENSSQIIVEYAERYESGLRHKFLFLDIGGIDPQLGRQLPEGVSYTQCVASYDIVAEIIKEHFRLNVPQSSYNKKAKPPNKSDTLKELLDRLDIAADAISDLRLNSTSEVVGDLRSISQQLRVRLANKDQHITQKDVKNTVTDALMVIARLFDYIENSKLAAIIVSGATTALMGCSGYSAAICVTVMLASWNGREAFMEAIKKLDPSKQIAKK